MKVTLIITTILVLLLGGLLLYRFYNPLVIKQKEVETVTINKTDTLIFHDTVSVSGKAKIIYLRDTVISKDDYMAVWDTSAPDGFRASVKFFSREKLFLNSFIIPSKIITNEIKTTTVLKENETAGVRNNFSAGGGFELSIENNFQFSPFLCAGYKKRIFALDIFLELKTLMYTNENNFKIIPAFRIGLSKEL